jgi:hypothetical protein
MYFFNVYGAIKPEDKTIKLPQEFSHDKKTNEEILCIARIPKVIISEHRAPIMTKDDYDNAEFELYFKEGGLKGIIYLTRNVLAGTIEGKTQDGTAVCSTGYVKLNKKKPAVINSPDEAKLQVKNNEKDIESYVVDVPAGEIIDEKKIAGNISAEKKSKLINEHERELVELKNRNDFAGKTGNNIQQDIAANVSHVVLDPVNSQNNNLAILQEGALNRIYLLMKGFGNTINLKQLGVRNSMDIEFDFEQNFIQVLQLGKGNSVKLFQNGFNNKVNIQQSNSN